MKNNLHPLPILLFLILSCSPKPPPLPEIPPAPAVPGWINGKNDTFGLVKIVSSYPHGSGYCRVIFTQISKKGKVRDFSETACKDVAYRGWQFIRN